MLTSLPRLVAAAAMASLAVTAPAAPAQKLNCVPVDPLIKVFRGDAVKRDGSSQMHAARGEHATFQLVVTSAPVELKDLRCEVTSFSLLGAKQGKSLEPRVRFVGYVPSSHGARKAAKDRLRKAPAMFPDPLLEEKTLTVHEGDNQPIWITVNIPTDTEPGDYESTSVVYGKYFGYETSKTLPLKLTVHAATIKHTRLFINNWMQMWHRGDLPMPERYSQQWWDLLRAYTKNMVEHRQNWARVETLWLTKIGRGADGKLTFDFSNFDHWVSILFEEGIEKVQSLQFAWRSGKWDQPYHVEVYDGTTTGYPGGKSYRGKMVPADSPEAQKFYAQWFPAFRDHLKEKGWLDKFVQAVGDEPVAANADSYTTASQYVRKYAPELPIIEAALAHNMVGAIDIWVPTLEGMGKNWQFFCERRAAGDKLWFYTCVQPEGEWANRFVELPLLKTRLMHWINYRYNIDGYLHWGYNFWREHPWDNAADGDKLPGGDSHIIYPSKEGYGIVDSIRWEAMRDGIEDHELLSQLGEKDSVAAMKLATRHILDWDKYDTDVELFRATRKELLEALSK